MDKKKTKVIEWSPQVATSVASLAGLRENMEKEVWKGGTNGGAEGVIRFTSKNHRE